MADYFGHSQFGGQHFTAMPAGNQGQMSPAYHSGFESLAPGQEVTYSMGASRKKGAQVVTNVGGVVFSSRSRGKK